MNALGWQNVRAHNRTLNLWARELLCDRWRVPPLTRNGSLLGSMSTIPLPGELSAMSETQATRFQKNLYHGHRIEIPIIPWQNKWHLRISCHVYNTPSDYERLATSITSTLKTTDQ
jgi:selenocysteine lyase/cysteine desulfurase